ncbi:LOW QUALITY PROTEIN: FAR1 domain-containing protein/SWIM domain-containing protein, partial [Cephalotus follicularis]
PYVNQEFDNLDDVYNFYNYYALHKGFGIRRSSSSKSSVTEELIWKKFVCDKEGWRAKNKEKYDESEVVSRCRETRDGCMASLNVRWKKYGKWVVTGFVEEHSHTLDTPRRTKKHRSHNVSHKISAAKDLMEQLHSCGMGSSLIAKAINTMGNITAITTDYVVSHLRKHRKKNVGREGYLVAMHFMKQMRLDSNFYFAIEYDSDGLQSMFLADVRTREEYFVFGDVIVFDITYKTNKFMMPFAPFTGVNHHKHESINSFFDGFVNSNTHLPKFVEQYNRALVLRRQAEEWKDYQTMNSNPKLITKFPFEKTVTDGYTTIMFKLFQAELHESVSCWYEIVSNHNAATTYIVGLCDEDKRKWWTVVYNEAQGVTLKCECAKFETEGYFCKHILKITQEGHLTLIPEQYMLKRW